MNLTSGWPYWLINSGLPANYPKLEQSLKTDIVIIGGGISGALTTYYLVKAGLSCIVVDARTVGLGSTSASTAMLQYELDRPLSDLSKQIGLAAAQRAYHMCSESINTIADISQQLNFNLFTKQQSLFYAAYKKDSTFLRAEFEARKRAGLDISLLDEKDIQEQFGFSAPSGILSAQGGSVDAYLFTHALLKSSVEKGLLVFDRTVISKITYERSGVKLTSDSGHTISAKKIVNATGYEITEFLDKKIVKLSSTYALASEHVHAPVPAWKDKILLWNTDDPYLYMRLTTDNRIILGGRDEPFFNPKRRDKLIDSKTASLVKDFAKVFPDIELIPEFKWTGTFGSTKDSLPYIGTYDKTPHTYYALGFGGNGITFSVIAAEIICDMILKKSNKDASLFAFDR